MTEARETEKQEVTIRIRPGTEELLERVASGFEEVSRLLRLALESGPFEVVHEAVDSPGAKVPVTNDR